MNWRQKIIKVFYPLIMTMSRLTKKNNAIISNETLIRPNHSLYNLSFTLNSGESLSLGQLKGKKILFANTASDCGYTNQYQDLQKLYQLYKDQLVVIGFPANDFKEQEKGTDEQIARFCQVNFGVNFPLAKKSVVIKTPDQHPVYKWLTDKKSNGWNDKEPSWNFSKYLVSEKGVLTHYFDPFISPLSPEVKQAIERP